LPDLLISFADIKLPIDTKRVILFFENNLRQF